MQPTFTNFLNELIALMLWAIASRQATAYAASKSFLKQEFVYFLGPRQAIYLGNFLSRYLIRAMKLTLPALLGGV
jgi:hypothetical protein